MNLVKEAAWTVSNVTAGNPEQIQKVIQAGILPPLIEVLIRGDFKAQKEASWAVTNLTSGGSVEQIVALCQNGVLRPFCDLLSAKDEKTVAVVLDGILNILNAADKLGEVEKVRLFFKTCVQLFALHCSMMHQTSNKRIMKAFFLSFLR
jgi:importin subunit alpha-2